MCAFSIGTETDGSVMFPADRNAVVGIKSTVGLKSTMGVIPEAPSMDTVGIFGRSAEDTAIVLDVIADKKSYVEPQADATQSVISQYDAGLLTSWLSNKHALQRARFGLLWKMICETAKNSEEHKVEYTALMKVVNRIEEAGARILRSNFQAQRILSRRTVGIGATQEASLILIYPNFKLSKSSSTEASQSTLRTSRRTKTSSNSKTSLTTTFSIRIQKAAFLVHTQPG